MAQQFGPNDFEVGEYYTINSTIKSINVDQNFPSVTHGKIHSITANGVHMKPYKVISGPFNNKNDNYIYRSGKDSSEYLLFSDMTYIKTISTDDFNKINERPANMSGGKRKKRRSTRRKSRVSKHKKRVHTKRR
jgi:hypothetical protein